MVKPAYLLDTNTWIYALKGQPPALVARLGSIDPDSVAFCSIVKAELLYSKRVRSGLFQRIENSRLAGLIVGHDGRDGLSECRSRSQS